MSTVIETEHETARAKIDSGWIPFEFLGPEIPIISFAGKANETETIWLTLDTGNSSGLHTSEAAARKLNMDFSQPIPVPEEKYSIGDDFRPSAYSSSLCSLALGDWNLEAVPATISNYVDYLAKSLNAMWEANVGYELFHDLCVTVDYVGSRVRFSDSPPVPTNSIRFRLGERPWVIVRARVNGTTARNFILDTGAGGTLLDTEFAAEIGLDLGEEVQVQGATGMGSARFAYGASVQVGRRKVSKLTVVVSDVMTPLSVGAGVKLSGIIGYDFLKDSIVVLDYKQQRIGFK